MAYVAAIYGFHITKRFEVSDLIFEPVTHDYSESRQLAKDLDVYHLTATITSHRLDPELIFKLEGILSFIEHLDVLISKPIEISNFNKPKSTYFPNALAIRQRNDGGGAVIGTDNLFPKSRPLFIEKALTALSDEKFCSTTKFNSLFFKCIETFRQRKPFIEISYFLLYSGLESYARAFFADSFPTIALNNNSAVPISHLLLKYEFSVFQENNEDLKRSISTYKHLRNVLFHNGDFQKVLRNNNSDILLNVNDYLYNLSMLVSLTIMKAIQFDDGHINWNAWIDRMLFK